MLEVRVKQLENQAREDFGYSESLMARLVLFLRRELRRRRPRRRMTTTKKTSRHGHQKAAMMTAPLAPSDFPEARVG
jgi:hypothetical protein